MSWVSLNKEGKRLWGDVFPDGRVPVCAIDFQKAELEGAGTEEVIMVNWTALTGQRQEAILVKIGKRSGARREWIIADIRKKGLPLRKRYTDGCVAMDPRFFI